MKPKLRFTHFTEDYFECRLNDITEIIKDGTHGTHENISDGIPLLSAKDIYDNIIHISEDCRKISIEDYNKIYNNYHLKENDILMTIVGTIGRTALYKNENIAFQRSVAIIRVDNINNPNYVRNYLESSNVSNQLNNMTNSSAQGGIYLNSLAKIKLFLPSKEEQLKVSDFLTLLDKKINLQSKKIEDLKLFKICISDRFFNAKSKETKKMLSNHCILLTGKSKVNQFDENGIYYIMDMGTVNADGYILKNKPTFCDLDMLSYGDLIMPKDDIGGGLIIGKTGFIDENNKYILGDHVYLIKTKNINSLYLHYQINSKYINKELKRKVTGSAQLGLKADNILNQEILVHPENNQNKIANIFELIDKKIKLENRKIENLFELKKGLMQSMFI